MSLRNTTLNLAKQRLQRCRQPPLKSDKKKKKKKEHDKKTGGIVKLSESEANKTLYLCFYEEELPGDRDRVCYVVRSIKLSDLFCSDSVDPRPLQQVTFRSGEDLPGFMGSGVLGSQIVFVGGHKPILRSQPTAWLRDMYVFDTDLNKQNDDAIRKIDGATLLGAKYLPVMIELGGKLYALSHKPRHRPSFEVFDPEMGTWSALPQPPFYRPNGPSSLRCSLSYAVSGTKIFMCLNSSMHWRLNSFMDSRPITHPVFCFDVSHHPDRGWRFVDSMCPFPFLDEALVLDLPGDHNSNKKIMFGYEHRLRLGVYIMVLDENGESMIKILDLELPKLPKQFDTPRICYIVHLGGQKACVVAPVMNMCEIRAPEFQSEYVLGSHRMQGVVLPFQFEVDITKIDKDANNCLTLQFMPTSVLEFYTSPSTSPLPWPNGCFLL